MRIVIESIPHEQQRYDTLGDWQFIGDELLIRVSEIIGDLNSLELTPFSNNKVVTILIGLHEMIEAILCQRDGITQEQVDAWDMGEGKNLEEPGNDPRAPYYLQHKIAEGFERGLAKYLGVNWSQYEKLLESIE